jgi:hypothetical protein
VVDSVIFFRYTPFAEAGLAFLKSVNNARFPLIRTEADLAHATVNDPALSARTESGPDFAFRTAVSTSGVTVPVFGFGIARAGRAPTELTNVRIASGVAITTSKFSSPPLICSARSSETYEVRAGGLRLSAFAPCANTATRVTFRCRAAASLRLAPPDPTSRIDAEIDRDIDRLF